jgi:peptidoglycan/LPS O-acetylase OafA/YrhL
MRSAYLDIIRGLACMQVLLLHIVEAFFPTLATEKISDFTLGGLVHGSPLYLIYDGYTGVFVFFLLSGYVLTPSFDKAIAPYKLLFARWGRLVVPAFLACAFSLLIKWMLFDVNPSVKAAQVSGSVFLQDWWQPVLDWKVFLKDSLINAVFLGYAETSALLSDRYLDSIATAFVAPLWTLSVEMHGSMIVLLLVYLRKRSPVLYGMCLMLLLVLVIRTYYLLFIIGHLLAVAKEEEWGQDKPTGAIIYLLAGSILCVMGEVRTFSLFESVCEADLPFALDCSGHTQKMVGAVVLFYGLLISNRMQLILRGRVLEWLGTHSFPIYLAHWPILCGLGSLALVLVHSLVPASPLLASVVAGGVTLGLTMVSALLFHKIDNLGIGFSRWLRKV